MSSWNAIEISCNNQTETLPVKVNVELAASFHKFRDVFWLVQIRGDLRNCLVVFCVSTANRAQIHRAAFNPAALIAYTRRELIDISDSDWPAVALKTVAAALARMEAA